jgi:hypothetical protein
MRRIVVVIAAFVAILAMAVPAADYPAGALRGQVG